MEQAKNAVRGVLQPYMNLYTPDGGASSVNGPSARDGRTAASPATGGSVSSVNEMMKRQKSSPALGASQQVSPLPRSSMQGMTRRRKDDISSITPGRGGSAGGSMAADHADDDPVISALREELSHAKAEAVRESALNNRRMDAWKRMKEELEMEVKRQNERATRAEEALAGGEAAEMAEKLARAQDAVQLSKQESQHLRDELKNAQRRIHDLEKAQRTSEDTNGIFMDDSSSFSSIDPSALASISRDRDEAVEKLKGKDREITRLKELAKAESSRAEGAENEALVLVSELREARESRTKMAAEVTNLKHELSENSEAFLRVEQALADALRNGETLEIEKKDLDMRMVELQESVETIESELENSKKRTLEAREMAKEAVVQLEDARSELQKKAQLLQDSEERTATIKIETAEALAAAKDAVSAAEARSMKEAEINYFREVLLRAFETENPSVVLPVAEKLLRFSAEDKKRALTVLQRERTKRASSGASTDLSGTVITLARSVGLQ